MVKKLTTIFFIGLFLILSLISLNQIWAQNNEEAIYLTWSTNAYVPANYSGKPLPTPGSLIEVVAHTPYSPGSLNDLTTAWYVDHQPVRVSSELYSPNIKYRVPSTAGANISFRLQIKEKGKTINSASIVVKIVEPQILLYNKARILSLEQNYGIKNNTQADIIALPYFFNINKLKDISYLWTLENQKTVQKEELNPHILNVSVSDIKGTIQNNLALEAVNTLKPVEKAKATTKIFTYP